MGELGFLLLSIRIVCTDCFQGEVYRLGDGFAQGSRDVPFEGRYCRLDVVGQGRGSFKKEHINLNFESFRQFYQRVRVRPFVASLDVAQKRYGDVGFFGKFNLR